MRIINENVQTKTKKTSESAMSIQSMLAAVLQKAAAGKKTNTQQTNEVKKRPASPPPTEPPRKKRNTEETVATPKIRKAKEAESGSKKSAHKTDKKETEEEAVADDEGHATTLMTQKVRTKVEKVAQSLSEHFAAAIGRDLVEVEDAEVGHETDEDCEDPALFHENQLRRELHLPVLKCEPDAHRDRNVFVLPKVDGMTKGETVLAQGQAEMCVDMKELVSEIAGMRRTLRSLCAAQVQLHQDMRFIRQAVGGEKLDTATKNVLTRCGQIMDIKTNHLLKGVPFTSTKAIAEFFLCPKRVAALANYVMSYAEYNCHFSGHIVQLCIEPGYKERIWWCDSSVE